MMPTHHTALLLALAKGEWALNEATINKLAPLADEVLATGNLELLQAHYTPVAPEVQRQMHLATPSAAAGAAPGAFRMGWFTDLDMVPRGSIAIVGVQGIIMKYGMCGIGSMDRAERIIEAANHPNVAGIMLEIDTPGGQVAGLSTLWDAIIEARKQKPVLAFINDGDCYSAGYNTASACTEIWASHGTCGVGSIGTMCQFTDTTEEDKRAGRKRVAVYATASTEKNAKYHKALAGDTTELVKELDLLNEDFHGKIRSQRGSKIKNESRVLKGQTMGAAEGVQEGLVDTIGSKELALARILELASEKPAAGKLNPTATEKPAETGTKPPFSKSTMNTYPHIAAALSIAEKDLVTTAEGSTLQPVQLAAIEAKLVTAATATTQLATVQGELTTANASLATASASLATAQADVTAKATTITELQQKLAKGPAAAGTDSHKTGQEEAASEAPKEEVDPYLAQVMANKELLGIPNK